GNGTDFGSNSSRASERCSGWRPHPRPLSRTRERGDLSVTSVTMHSDSRTGIFFPLWALALPITSVLVLPGLQGTTPGNVFAFLLLAPGVAVLTLGFTGANSLYRGLIKRAMVFVLLNAIAQLGLATFDFPGFGAAQMVDPFDRSVVLRG